MDRDEFRAAALGRPHCRSDQAHRVAQAEMKTDAVRLPREIDYTAAPHVTRQKEGGLCNVPGGVELRHAHAAAWPRLDWRHEPQDIGIGGVTCLKMTNASGQWQKIRVANSGQHRMVAAADQRIGRLQVALRPARITRA